MFQFGFSGENMEIDGIKKLLDSKYKPNTGYFGKENGKSTWLPAMQWFACREEFHAHIDRIQLREYFYVCNSPRNVAHFIYKIEQHFDVAKSKFMFTENPNIVWINVSPWWVENPMKHSFFTICLRASLSWDRNGNVGYYHPKIV